MEVGERGREDTGRAGQMKKSSDKYPAITEEYRQFISDIKARITAARLSAARAVNRDLILLYWDIGRGIAEKQKILGWGESVVDRISSDLQAAFLGTAGFSPRNLWDMKRFYLAYTDKAIWRQVVAKLNKVSKGLEIWPQSVAKLGETKSEQFLRQLVAEIPWGHNLLILNKLIDPAARLFYLHATAQFGWSRNVLLNQINDKERGPGDQPSIGIILCAEKDDVEVEYALRTKANPIGVAAYQLQPRLPGELRGKLPTAKQLAEVVRAELKRGR